MQATEREKRRYGEGVEILSRDGACTVYRIGDVTGEVRMTCYQVFAGIELIYNDVHMEHCTIGESRLGNVLAINHCREGRIECEFQDEFCYLSKGDMAIARKDDAKSFSYFPLKHYHGISIEIDADCAPDCLSSILDDVNVRPTDLISKFCQAQKCFVVRNQPEMEQIFSELYAVPESIRQGYFKVKVLELLLYLSAVEDRVVTQARLIPGSQVALAKAACKYLTEHMDRRVTLEQLSQRFHVCGTQLRSSFKNVYGESIYAYTRAQKMQAAAVLLKQTDHTVLEIASSFGYDNPSKFARAFQDVMGFAPNEYRARADCHFGAVSRQNGVDGPGFFL